MIVRRGLLQFLWRSALPATLIGALGLGAYALLWPNVISIRDIQPAALVYGHCLLLAWLLGRPESPAFAFLYSRGYSRDMLWEGTMLVCALSVLAAWLPAALIVWLGLRSLIQDRLFQRPDFPVMAPCETWMPLIWLGLYLLLAPVFHYAWIRRAQPTRGGRGGLFLSLGILLVLLVSSGQLSYFTGWFAWLSAVFYIAVVICLVLGGRVLHRSLEVRA
jgi:hypothetical protein